MKAYLYTTCVIFGLFSIGHVVELFYHWSALGTDKWFLYSMTAVIIVSGALSIWAFVLIRMIRGRAG
jgi:dolichyl-phosphate-mannose--protein O-mannosyl transferase